MVVKKECHIKDEEIRMIRTKGYFSMIYKETGELMVFGSGQSKTRMILSLVLKH